MKSSYILSIYRNNGPQSLVGIVKCIATEEIKAFNNLRELESIVREFVDESQDKKTD